MNEQDEWLICAESPLYFLDVYCQVYDATVRGWVPLQLWPAQVDVVRALIAYRHNIMLKARQLGMTWLLIGFALWLILFRPAATVMLFSKRDDEAVNMLDFRLKGMYQRLPPFMRARAEVVDAKHEWRLSNGSMAMAFPTTGGDSYTASFVLIDEADLVPDLDRLLSAVKPTIDAGGQLALISRVDKSAPMSSFKNIYSAGKQGLNEWHTIFLPWAARPGRTAKWYADIKREIVTRTGSEDELWEQYPETDVQALAGRTLDKRIPPKWLAQCYRELSPVTHKDTPTVPGLIVFRPPLGGRSYVIGADPAEGNPTSDPSPISVLDEVSGEECALVYNRFEPGAMGHYIAMLSKWYNSARALIERNNHGHAVIMAAKQERVELVSGPDGKDGWLSNERGNAMLYDNTTANFRDGQTLMHSLLAFTQLGSINGSTLSAPEGMEDDVADAYSLALMARNKPPAGGFSMKGNR